MKPFAVLAGFGSILGFLIFPMLFAGGDTPPLGCGTNTVSVDVILATIRHLESGGDYQARSTGSSASGAYQFLDSTWAGYGGYSAAWLAPPDVQDAKAAAYVREILSTNNQQVTAVPVVWYIGHVPPDGSWEWDTVPAPSAGNVLTPRQYQTRWMGIYRDLLGAATPAAPPPTTTPVPTMPASDSSTTTTSTTPTGLHPCTGGQSIAPLAGGWSLPGPRDVLAATAGTIGAPHHDFPAWDWPVPEGTPIYAVRGGNVVSVDTWPYNWWSRGCDTNSAGCSSCGVGVTIADTQGAEWTYCHGSALYVQAGDTVTAGTQILASGNTGASTGPHLHLQISTDGTLRCPQPLIQSLFTSGVGIDPFTLPASGCTY